MQPNYYQNIDELPIKIWFEVLKTEDYTLLIKDSAQKIKLKANELSKAWEVLFNDWIKRFDFSEEYKENLEAKINIAMLQAEYIITGKKHYLTMANVEKDVLKMNGDQAEKPLNLESILWRMSKHYGFKLSSRDLTVTEYYSAINDINNG